MIDVQREPTAEPDVLTPPPYLGALVRERRLELGLTQVELAQAAGISQAHVSEIESGKVVWPSVDIRLALARALKVRPADVLLATGQVAAVELGPGSAPRPVDDEAAALFGRLDPDGQRLILALVRRLLGAR